MRQSCKHFNVEKLSLCNEEAHLVATEKDFNSLLCIGGEGKIVADGVEYDTVKGDSYYIPAELGEYAVSGNIEIIRTQL